MFKNYIKTALRNLWKNKTYSFLNIMGLSIGITCAALIFLWVEDELTYDHQNVKRNYLYEVLENQTYEAKTYTFSATPGVLAEGMKDEIPGIRNTCRTTWRQSLLFALDEKSIYEKGYYADGSLLNMFTVPFVKGNPKTVFSQLNNLVISETMAAKFFGNTDPLGKTLKVNNKENFLITGVFKDFPQNSTLQFDWLMPFQIYLSENEWLKRWGNNGIITYAELEPSANAAAINKKLFNYIRSKDTSAIARPFLLAMKDWRLRSNFEEGKQTGGRIVYVNLFTTIAWIILLIACINFMNLATARSEKRAREVGVRKVLGAAKKMLVLQFIGEAMLMSLIAVLIAIGIIYLVLPSFNLLVEKKLYLALNNPVHNTALLAIALICGLVAGSYPSLYLSSFNPISVLKGLRVKAGSASFIRKGLVVLQFTISIVLIISTIIIYQQIQHVKNRDLGYNKNNLLQTTAYGDVAKHFDVVKQDLLKTGYVENAAISTLDVLEMGSSTDDFVWDGKDPNKKVLITMDWVSPEFISTAGFALLKGRSFGPVVKSDSLNIIINESLAKLIGKKDPVGSLLRRDSINYQVIGVVKDFVYGDMYGKADPLVFFCAPANGSYVYIRLKQTARPEPAIAAIGTVMKSANPAYPFDYYFVDKLFDQLFKSEMLIGKLSRIFAVLAILISCLGLFGLAAYTAERRTKEIGIRKVLGASVKGITALLSSDFIRLVLLSFIIAFPLAWWAMHKWLEDFAYRITINPAVFFFAGIIALLIALLTIIFQSIRAAVANPASSLRTE
ncbi:MAG: ABC transporter permease [Flavisolibacter sp.]